MEIFFPISLTSEFQRRKETIYQANENVDLTLLN